MPETPKQQARRQQLRAERLAARIEIEGRLVATEAPRHGDASIYRNWGCRCGPCTAANTTDCRVRTSPPDPALRNGRQWWAPTTMTATLAAHLLAVGHRNGVRSGLCGRPHRSWQELEKFSAPDQIPFCSGCVAAAGASEAVAVADIPRLLDNGGKRGAREPVAMRVAQQQRRAAIYAVAQRSHDATDLAGLLDVLGLDVRDVLSTAARPGQRTRFRGTGAGS